MVSITPMADYLFDKKNWSGYGLIRMICMILCPIMVFVSIIGTFVGIVIYSVISTRKPDGFNSPHPIINAIPGEIIKNFDDFIVSYNVTGRRPNYSLHMVQESRKMCEPVKWTTHSNLNAYSKDDYNFHLNIVKGQMVPAQDVPESCQTYDMANIIPMYNKGFLRTYVDKIEGYIRETYNGFYVLSVPIYDLILNTKRKKVSVDVPTGIYKIILNQETVMCSIYITHNVAPNITFNMELPKIINSRDKNECIIYT